MSEVTRILNALEQGDNQAVDKLLPVAYRELRTQAQGGPDLPAWRPLFLLLRRKFHIFRIFCCMLGPWISHFIIETFEKTIGQEL